MSERRDARRRNQSTVPLELPRLPLVLVIVFAGFVLGFFTLQMPDRFGFVVGAGYVAAAVLILEVLER